MERSSEFGRRRISDEELRELAQKAIEAGESKTGFGYELKAQGISLGEGRLNRIWAELEGPVQRKGGWL